MTATTTLEQFERFFELIFEPDDIVEIRCLRGDREHWRRYVKAREASVLVPTLSKMNDDGWNVYAGVNPRKGHGGKDVDVALARCVFVDHDDASAAMLAGLIDAKGIAAPTMVIDSGNGSHAYWRLEEPLEDLGQWATLQRGAIAALNTDATIKNPSRIMRVPGFINAKPGKPPRPASIFRYVEDEPHAIDDLGIDPLEQPHPPSQIGEFEVGDFDEPHPLVWRFLTTGETGMRNPDGSVDGRRKWTWESACDLAARNYPIDEARRLVAHSVAITGVDAGYADDALRRAYAKAAKGELTPRHQFRDEDVDWALQRMLGDEAPDTPPVAAEPGDASERPATPPPAPTARRPRVANVLTRPNPNGKGKPVRVAIPLEKVIRHVKACFGGWPRSLNGILFEYDHETEDGLPSPRGLRVLGKPDAFFAWMHERGTVHMWEGEAVDADGEPTSAVKRGELFSAVQQWTEGDHLVSAIEMIPHEPEIPGVFYVPCDLPEPTGRALRTFVNAFNAATDLDRAKIEALILTTCWGGPPGKRPAFVFTSEAGRGAGKTSSARAIGLLVGGLITMSEGEDPAVFLQRLFSDDSLNSRGVLIDNVKGRVNSGQLEAWITGPTVEGKRMYHGGVRRRNDMTWILTANTASFSRDLAERSVIIQLGEPQTGGRDFDSWVASWMRENRPQLIADIIDRLRSDPMTAISPANGDRWGLWQSEILGRIETGDAVAKSIKSARATVDADSDEAAMVETAIRAAIEDMHHDPNKTVAKFSPSTVAKLLRYSGLRSNGDSDVSCLAWLRHRMDAPCLRHRFASGRTGRGRYYRWTGENAPENSRPLAVEVVIDYLDWVTRRSGEITAEPTAEADTPANPPVEHPRGDVGGIPF